jgi:hypothetical protein
MIISRLGARSHRAVEPRYLEALCPANWPAGLTLQPEARLNNSQESSPYREENTTPHRYKDHPVNGV